MSSVQYLREFVTERLTAAAEEIFGVFEQTIVEYEEEIDRQRRLKPEIQLDRIELPQQHVCKEEEVHTDQQFCKQERNSSLDQEDPEPAQIKEEQEEVSQEGEQLVLKQHVDSGSTRNGEPKLKTEHHSNDIDNCTVTEIARQRRAVDVWKLKIKLHRIELPQQFPCKVKVLTDQQLCNQERNSSLDQEDPDPPQIKEEQDELCTSQEGEQLVLKQETHNVMLIPTYEESDHSKPEPISDHQLLSHSSPVAESENGEGSHHVDSGSTRNVEPEPKKKHTQADKTSFKCDTCSKVYQYKYQLNIHRRIHTGEKPYVCQRCRKRFRKTSELKKHINIHKGQNQYLCRTCGKGFEAISKFKRHKKTHTGERPYSCDTCGKGFSQVSGLKAHIKVHTDERPHVCKTCGKKFRETSKLKKHIRIHTGDKPYLCNTCGKRFTEKSVLIRHERVHTGERPYPCDTCGKKFKQAAALSTHLKIHTGEKPHRCKACGKQFYRLTHLRSHMRIHTI